MGKCFLILLMVSIQVPASIALNAQLAVDVTLCEKKINPLGIPTSGATFSWQLTSDKRNQFQSAYQLVVATSKEALMSGTYDVWNSGEVKNSESIFVRYGGKKLQTAGKYFWRVRVWDSENKVSPWSSVNYFITALESEADWQGAKWIGYEDLPDSMRVAPGAENAATVGNRLKQRAVVPYFRKEIIAKKRIRQALIFVSGLGQYELSLNGKKAADNFMAPGWTYYDKQAFYNIYDVTSKLVVGNNAIGVLVGNGFYYINKERYIKMVIGFGYPKMIFNLRIEYADGTKEIVVSDESWKTDASPIIYSSIYGGEDYDARAEQPGWNTPLFDDSQWKKALVLKSPTLSLIAEQDYPVKIKDSFAVKNVLQPQPGKYIYDFGQNISGIIEIKVKGKKGQVLKFTPAELLNKQQLPNQAASGDPYYFTYTLKGDTVETWRPVFTYYGFRYVLIEWAQSALPDMNAAPRILSMVSLHNRNSAPSSGTFQCSNQLFNKINELIRWAIKSNMQSVITDCPHREKLSWLEQDHLMGNSIHYNYDIYHLYKKLVGDMIEAQLPNGLVPDIAPELVVFGGGFRDSPEWGSASVIVPWLLYKLYGDTAILGHAYPMIKKYVTYLQTKSKNNIVSHGLGDWYDYGPKPPGVAQLTPVALTATAIYYYDVMLLSKIASLLDKNDDAATYKKLEDEIKIAFNKKFFNPNTKVYATGSQTAMAMPLCLNLVQEEDRQKVLENLIDTIVAGNKALTAGDVGFHYLVQALDEGGASQLLFEMNNRNDVAGYGYQLKKGATALTESWAALEEVSNNHLMLGHLMEWFYSGVAGISQEDNSVGFKHIKIRPQPVGDISSAKASFGTPYGMVISDWKLDKNVFTLKVKIPVNTSATIYLPGNSSSVVTEAGKLISNVKGIQMFDNREGVKVIRVGSGDYLFVVR